MGGGGGYDRDVYEATPSSSSSGFDYSPYAARAFEPSYPPSRPSRSTRSAGAVSYSAAPEPPAKPVKPVIPSSPHNRRLACKAKHPIVFLLDVTGSTRDSVKLVYDKIPMFFGQMVGRNYLEDFAVSLAAFGDVTCDRTPLQVFDFEKGKVLDTHLESMTLEGGGGSGTDYCESSNLGAYYYAHQVDYAAQGERGFLFIIGDERPYDSLEAGVLSKVLGGTHQSISTKKVFEKLTRKYRTFALCTPYRGGGYASVDTEVRKSWRKYLPEQTVEIAEPKSVVDVMLGLIATSVHTRTLAAYVDDMKDRDQSEFRVENVEEAIKSVRLS